KNDLVVYFVSVQVTLTIHIARGAKLAGEATAYLGTHTGCHTVWRRYQYAFDDVVVVKYKAAFDGIVATALFLPYPNGVDGERLLQRIAQGLAQVAHFFEI